MKIAVLSQVVNGVVLPFVLIFMLLLINKKELMGEYVNSHLFNAIAWANDGGHDRADDCVVLDLARRRLALPSWQPWAGRDIRKVKEAFPRPDPSPGMHPLRESHTRAERWVRTTADRGRCDFRVSPSYSRTMKNRNSTAAPFG